MKQPTPSLQNNWLKALLFLGAVALIVVATFLIYRSLHQSTLPSSGFKACEILMGSVDDKSFNATAWKGITDAMKAAGIKGVYLESSQQTDYEKDILAFLTQDCDLIISVGALMGDATRAVATANPEQKFAIVDFAFDPVIPNVRGEIYSIDQATFLAGYLAAGMTKTGKIGTYGGMQVPTVTAFMDGFALGVEAYNTRHGTSVQTLGWNYQSQTGLFTGDFKNTDNGKHISLGLIDEGADIIMPVAGPVGQGTLAALRERNTGLMIGVDTDWSMLHPEDADFVLASALKKMDRWVQDTIRQVIDGTFKGETFIGGLDNGYVDCVYGSKWADQIPTDLKTELDALKADIITGKIKTTLQDH